ncbi:hypothetical protein HY621_01590 [Candidatus Uhrbacteria bacterium]|nr:hypothetical protein [Candidatus Uhrbacteria bacterium]
MPENRSKYIHSLEGLKLKPAPLERRQKRGKEGNKTKESSAEAKRIYEEQKGILQRLIERKKGEIEKTETRLQAFKDDIALTADKRERFVAAVENILASHKYELQRFEGQLKFLRPPMKNDMRYRMRVYKELPDAIEQATPSSLGYLRFHGSPIFATETIIRNGVLSSSVDHADTQSSYDVSDQVSVTTPKTVETTIRGYFDQYNYKYSLPMGAVFVLRPRDEEDARAGETSMLMRNADLKNQLIKIFTSPEMLPQVKQWLKESDFDPDLATESFAYVDELKAQST